VDGQRLRFSLIALRIALLMLVAIELGLAVPDGAAASSISILSPTNGAIARGTVTIATSESSDVSSINVFVDNHWIASNSPVALPPFAVSWNSVQVANGSHVILVIGYDYADVAIASTLIQIMVANPSPTPTPRPTAIPTRSPKATATPMPTHTPTRTPTHTPVRTPTHTPVRTPTHTPVRTPTHTPVRTPSHTPVRTPTHTPMRTPTRTPVRTPTRTPTPRPTSTRSPAPVSYPLSDAAAAKMVALNPKFEPRPQNYPANDTKPTALELAQVGLGRIRFLNSQGNGLLVKVTGNYSGTTDEILQWASYKWGFDPDTTRATAVTETHWYQYDIGDIADGVSLGILQIKSADYTGTCNPVALSGDLGFITSALCLSHNSTAFAADYKLAYQRTCMNGSIPYLYSATPTSGYPGYAEATGTARLWGCIGDWYSGSWYDGAAISYIRDVEYNLSAKPWLRPGF
jgi:hypothetical protein